MKNVTGLDLVKLLAGAHGTLGVLTEVAFKLLPRPETSGSLCLRGQTVQGAVAAMAMAMGSPFEVSGAVHVPQTGETFLRVEGFAASVAYRLERLTSLMAGQGAESAEVANSAELWRGLRDVAPLCGLAGDLWRLSVQPSTAPALVALMPGGARTMLDWAGGRIWAVVPEGCDLRRHLGPINGHASLLRSASTLPLFPPEAPAVAALSAALRAKFDPKALFNRGIMG